MQIHHEWVLVGRVSGRVQHSWRCAGESVGAGLIYRDVRLLGEGRVQLGVILAQQGCQRSVASSPLTPGRGAAGPPQERNRAGVTPGQGQCPALQCSGLSPSSGCQPPAPLALCVPLCVLSTGPPPPPMLLLATLPTLSSPSPAGAGGCPSGLYNPQCVPTQAQRPLGLRAAPYLRRRWSGLLQGPPEKRRWLKGAEGGRLFTASSHGRIGDVGRRMGTRDLRLQAGRDTSTLDPVRTTAGHGL